MASFFRNRVNGFREGGWPFFSLVFLAFATVFACLPLPHGNVYAFLPLCVLCGYYLHKVGFNAPPKLALTWLFWAWPLIGLFWSADKPLTLKTLVKIGAILLGGRLWGAVYRELDPRQKSLIRGAVFSAAMAVACLMSIDIARCELFYGGYPSHQGWFKYIDASVTLALVHGCVACALTVWIGIRRISAPWRVAIICALCLTVWFATSDAAALAVALGGIALALYRFLPRLTGYAFVYGMPLVWVCFPFVFKFLTCDDFLRWTLLDTSHTHRLFIWSSVSAQTFERFWTGFGLGASRHRYLFAKPEAITVWRDGVKTIMEAPEVCSHPHNFMAQVWLELGVIGVIIGCFFWITYWRKRYAETDGYTIAFWVSALCVAATGISLWQSWWLILLALLAPLYGEKINENSLVSRKT